jgi:hypothetical protein
MTQKEFRRQKAQTSGGGSIATRSAGSVKALVTIHDERPAVVIIYNDRSDPQAHPVSDHTTVSLS